MAEEHDLFGEALQDLRFREDLGFGAFDVVSSRQRRLRYPDFLIIGAQKAGTTWLHNNLNYHPNVWLAPTKEINYFSEIYAPSPDGWEREGRLAQARESRAYLSAQANLSARQQLKFQTLDTLEEPEVSDEWYGRIFANAPAEDLCGESSPEYCVLPRSGVAHVASLSPSCKVILLLRDPIDRLWSHVRMAERGGYSDATFERLSDDYVWRTYGGRSNYPEMLRRWTSMLGAERVIVLNHDWIADDPTHLLRTVTQRLGLGFDENFFPRARSVIGGGVAAAMPDELHALAKARLRHVYVEMLDSFPEFFGPWFARHYSSDEVGPGNSTECAG